MAHGFFGGEPVDAVDRRHGDAIQSQTCGPEGGVDGDNALHGAAVIASVAHHARQSGGHVAQGERQRFIASALQECQSAGHPAARCNGTAAEGRQFSGVFLDIVTHEEAERCGAKKLLPGVAADLLGSVERQGGNDAVGPASRDAHGGAGESQHARLYGGIAEEGGRCLFVFGDNPTAVLLKKMTGEAGLTAFERLVEKGEVDVVGLLQKSDFIEGHRECVVQDLAQGVAMNGWRRRSRRGLDGIGPGEDDASVFGDLHHIGVRIAYDDGCVALVGGDVYQNIDAAAVAVQFDMH